MNWHYAKDGGQRGPVTAEALLRLLETGEIQPDTLVWTEGMSDWMPLAQAGVMNGPAGEEMAVCAHSGALRPKAEMIPYGDLWVSPEHRDAFVENLMAGKEYGASRDGVVPDDYTVPIGEILSRGWSTLAADFWPNVGVSALVILLIGISSNIPCVGSLASFFQVPLYAGLYWYFLRKIRGQYADIGLVFSGFSRQFLHLFLTGLILIGFTFVLLIPGLVPFVIGMNRLELNPNDTGAMLLTGGGFIAMALPMLYLQTVFLFSSILCIDRRMKAWPCVVASVRTVNKHWFQCFLFILVMGLLAMAGTLALCLGVFVAMPLIFICTVHLYEHIYGPNRAEDMLAG